MQVTMINGFTQFDALKGAWESAYAADPHATICVSWSWLRGWFEVTPHSWFVLAVRPNSYTPYVGFLPMAMASSDLLMGGTPLADYSGFVCPPEYESRALRTFAEYVGKKLKWDVFRLINGMDSRLEEFLGYFTARRFIREQSKLGSCPYIRLPGSWDQYLRECLGPKTSRDIRRSLKKIDASPDCHVTCAEKETLDYHIDTLLSHWHARWGMPDYYREGFRKVFHRTFMEGILWLSILWDGVKPIGAVAGFLERDKKTFTACITTSDVSYTQLRPGKAIYAYSIKYAIDNGCEVYDFTQGNEDYKFSFGAVERFSPSIIMTHRTLRIALREVRDRLESRPVIGRLARMIHIPQWMNHFHNRSHRPYNLPPPIRMSQQGHDDDP